MYSWKMWWGCLVVYIAVFLLIVCAVVDTQRAQADTTTMYRIVQITEPVLNPVPGVIYVLTGAGCDGCGGYLATISCPRVCGAVINLPLVSNRGDPHWNLDQATVTLSPSMHMKSLLCGCHFSIIAGVLRWHYPPALTVAGGAG